jgi:hypothetical protein
MTGAALAKALARPSRSARRWLANYRYEIAPPVERITAPAEMMDAVVFDIETTDFGTEGYAGWMVCCSFLPLMTGKVETLEIKFDDRGSDRELLTAVATKLAQYSFHIGHNIAAFDYNWLNSRMMFHGLQTLDAAYYFDTFQVAKSLAIKTRKGLGNLIDYFGLDGTKTTIYRTSWSRVMSPHKVEFELGLAEIVEHCELDVEANRRLFDILHRYSMLNGRTSAWKLSKHRGNYWGNLT